MCGIAGLVDFTGAPTDQDLLNRMTSCVAHRGPDAAGTWQSRAGGVTVALGHRRLKIIDLSDAAAQPMQNDGCTRSGRATPLSIVFNGEIYNYTELRRGLIARGHALASHSDTEVILHLYEEQGPACVNDLRGMFALAIWDDARRLMFCARDRLGKKPLYYRHDGSRFWFASEPAAILQDARVPRCVCEEAIHSYLSLGYVPGSASAHEALTRLPPAHLLRATSSGVHVERYWARPDDQRPVCAEHAAMAEFREQLRESVRLRLVSDVPVGAFLSGGLDSALVVATMALEAGHKVPTFTIGFEDAAFDERPLAALVSQRFGTEHHPLAVRVDDAVALAPTVPRVFGEPFADSSAIPTLMLSKLVKDHVTVALSGDGGDESFAGYRRYRALGWWSKYQRAPTFIRSAVAKGVSRFPAPHGRAAAYDVLRFFDNRDATPVQAYASWFGFFDDRALAPDFIRRLRGHEALTPLADPFAEAVRLGLAPADAAMRADFATYLPDDLLVKVDTASMAHGLEVRAPFLDQELVAWAARLPLRLKQRGLAGKYLIRRLAEQLLPAPVLRARKRGFGVPLDRWFRQDLRDLVHSRLLDSSARVNAYVGNGVVKELVAQHERGVAHGQRLWCLLMLELWLRTWDAQIQGMGSSA
jgi:asparagine synthase (glutamine-hydrolysing)